MIKSKKQMYLVIGAFALVLMLGTVTYAFFNYTRTGSANIIKTGRIYFNSEQGTAINLTNLFPIDPTETGIMNDATKVGTVTINVTGDTTYTGGIEYLVSAVNVENYVGNKQLPISIDVSVASNSNNDPATTLGTADSDYFTNRGVSANTSIYKVLASDVIANNDQLLVGYIKSGATGVDGNIVIKAYINKAKIAISDTYPEEATDTNNDGYLDGTPTSYGEGKTVFTTAEWNSLQTNGVSFQVKVEANEGTWVEEPAPQVVPVATVIETCPGCVFKCAIENVDSTKSTEFDLYYGENGSVLNSSDISLDYANCVNSDFKYFAGLILQNGTSGKVLRGFACGISMDSNAPFCIEGTNDSSRLVDVHNSNKSILQSVYGDSCNDDLICYKESWNDNNWYLDASTTMRDDNLSYGVEAQVGDCFIETNLDGPKINCN